MKWVKKTPWEYLWLIGVVMFYKLDSQGSVPVMDKICLTSKASILAQQPTWPPIQLILGIKWLECEADHSPPSGPEDKNGVPPLPHVFLA
jgi:hypothetical protein